MRKLMDKSTGVVVMELITNNSMTVDEWLEMADCTVDDDGQIRQDGELLDAWYDDLCVVRG